MAINAHPGTYPIFAYDEDAPETTIQITQGVVNAKPWAWAKGSDKRRVYEAFDAPTPDDPRKARVMTREQLDDMLAFWREIMENGSRFMTGYGDGQVVSVNTSFKQDED